MIYKWLIFHIYLHSSLGNQQNMGFNQQKWWLNHRKCGFNLKNKRHIRVPSRIDIKHPILWSPTYIFYPLRIRGFWGAFRINGLRDSHWCCFCYCSCHQYHSCTCSHCCYHGWQCRWRWRPWHASPRSVRARSQIFVRACVRKRSREKKRKRSKINLGFYVGFTTTPWGIPVFKELPHSSTRVYESHQPARGTSASPKDTPEPLKQPRS